MAARLMADWQNSEEVPVMGNGAIRPADTLTKREKEVVECVIRGMKNKEIANALGLSESTIKVYLYAIYDKRGVSNRVELVIQHFRKI